MSRLPRGQLQAETAAALQTPSVPEKYFALMSILQRLTPENWSEVLAAFAEERKLTGLAHSEAFEMFVRRAGEAVGKDAVSHFLQGRDIANANQALMGWASKHPAEALQWPSREADPDTRRSVLGAAIRGLALSEPDLASRTLEDLPAPERSKYTVELVTSMLRAVGIDQTQGLVEGMIARAIQAGTDDPEGSPRADSVEGAEEEVLTSGIPVPLVLSFLLPGSRGGMTCVLQVSS